MSESESRQTARVNEPVDSGIGNELILILVFERLKWDIHALCRTASVSCRLRALAKRLLWRHLCLHRAPRMASSLTNEGGSRIVGGWQALAKLMFFCAGCGPTRHFRLLGRPSPGHFLRSARFSKTSGRSFLARGCRGDELYVSDPCEHPSPGGGGQDLGLYRGVFRSFQKSRTREILIRRQVGFEAGVRCPYCGARAWSMTAARLVPTRIAARRLGSTDGALEYLVCLNGHLHGACWLAHLSSDDDGDDDVDPSDSEEEEEEEDQVSSLKHMEDCRGKLLLN